MNIMDHNTELPVSKHNTSMTNSVMLQHGSMALNFMIDPFKHGLVPTLNMFGYKLWHGYPRRDVFLHQMSRYQEEAHHDVVKKIIAKQDPGFDNLTNEQKESINQELYGNRQSEAAFTRYLTKLALIESWNLPALINRGESGIMHQITGSTRCFATIMTKPDPWTHFPVLMLDHAVNDINDVLENPTLCSNDEILHEVFGKTMTENTWDPDLIIGMDVSYNHYKINCNMTYIHNGYYYDHHQGRGQDLLESHVAWRKKVGFRPKLYIHTNNPQNIKDNGVHWDVQFAPLEVDQDFVNECAKRPAWFEKVTKAYCDNPTHETDSFVLWVLDDRTISLSDLAWWGDDQTNVMIDGDWKFILYQHSDSYRAKSIRISQAKY
jgi:hypothetical protein